MGLCNILLTVVFTTSTGTQGTVSIPVDAPSITAEQLMGIIAEDPSELEDKIKPNKLVSVEALDIKPTPCE
jgi:hypothetical protein